MKILMFLCALLGASPAFADDDKPGSPVEEDKPEGKPRGKFSLVGTVCKPDDDAGLETTPGSPPLDVDDPGTPGCNGWEINLVTSGEFGKTTNWETPLFDVNYGVGDNIQLKYEVPYQFGKIDGVSKPGFGRSEFGIKYRFYEDESNARTIAIYPQVEFAIPGTSAASGDEGTGTIIKLPALMSTKIGETSKGDVMITANIGYNISRVAMTEHYISGAFGIGFPLMSKVAIMIEASTEQALSKNMDSVRASFFKANVGLFGPVNEHLLWFAAAGRSLAPSEPDDSGHTVLLMGIRVLAGGP